MGKNGEHNILYACIANKRAMMYPSIYRVLASVILSLLLFALWRAERVGMSIRDAATQCSSPRPFTFFSDDSVRLGS